MDAAMEHDKLVAIQKQGEKVEKKKKIWQDRKDDLAQARKGYEEESDVLLEMVKPDNLPLLGSDAPKGSKK